MYVSPKPVLTMQWFPCSLPTVLKRMPFFLHLTMLLFCFSCKAEVNQTYSTSFENKTILTVLNSTNILHWLDTINVTASLKTQRQSVSQDFYILQRTKTTTAVSKTAPKTIITTIMGNIEPISIRTTKMVQHTTTKKPFLFTSRYAGNNSTRRHPSTTCVCKDERFKTGIMICAIIIAVLVLICAALIICSMVLASKVSSLKSKLTQSKRQARSNGDFLSASSILWPSGIETWQKKSQTANQTMDEISLGEANTTDEKHTLMTKQTIDILKDANEDNKTSSNNETMTVLATVEV